MTPISRDLDSNHVLEKADDAAGKHEDESQADVYGTGHCAVDAAVLQRLSQLPPTKRWARLVRHFARAIARDIVRDRAGDPRGPK